MQDPTPQTRLLGRALIGLGVLALPLTASISYAAQDAPPAAPAAPTAPTAPRIERQVMIIDHRGGATPDDPSLITRTITRDGRTIVFKSAEPLSDAEVEKRVEQALASIPEIPEPPVPPIASGAVPAAPAAPAVPAVPARNVEWHSATTIVNLSGSADRARQVQVLAADRADCQDKEEISRIDANSESSGKLHVVAMRFCGTPGNAVGALDALRAARVKIVEDERLTPEMREKVLKQLDAEIGRLSKAG